MASVALVTAAADPVTLRETVSPFAAKFTRCHCHLDGWSGEREIQQKHLALERDHRVDQRIAI
jgi:hypothetical protein